MKTFLFLIFINYCIIISAQVISIKQNTLKKNLKWVYYQNNGNDKLLPGAESGSYYVDFIPISGTLDTLSKQLHIQGKTMIGMGNGYIPFAKVSRVEFIDSDGNIILGQPIAVADSLGYLIIDCAILGIEDNLYIYTNDYRIPIPLCYQIGKLL